MGKTQRNWSYNGQRGLEDAVRMRDAEDYLRGELLSTLAGLFSMMCNQNRRSNSPLEVACKIGETLTSITRTRMDQVFTNLRAAGINFPVILKEGIAPGFFNGALIAAEVEQGSEVAL